MTQTYRPMAAALWMTGSIASFSAMAVAGRAVAAVHDTFEIMTWRSATGILIVTIVALVTGRFSEVKTTHLTRHLARNLFHFAGQNLWFFALTVIPLAQVFALEFTSPIWVIALSAVFLGERITGAKGLAAALGFGGIVIVARPDFAHLDVGVLAAAASAVCFAGTMILTKALTRQESIVSIMFWLTLMQLFMGLATAGHDGAITLPTAQTAPWLILIGCAGLLAHFCLTTALSLAPASIVGPIDFARLPVIVLVGLLVYQEPLQATVALGAALILAGNWINIRASNKTAQAQQSR